MLPVRQILLVEDDEDDQLIFLETMAEIYPAGKILIAYNGKEALELLTRTSPLPDLIFMDINMPLMNGLDCLRQIKLKVELMAISVYMLSTSPSRIAVSIAQRLGADGYLTKPFSRMLLSEKLLKVLEIACSGATKKHSGFLELITHETISDEPLG